MSAEGDRWQLKTVPPDVPYSPYLGNTVPCGKLSSYSSASTSGCNVACGSTFVPYFSSSSCLYYRLKPYYSRSIICSVAEAAPSRGFRVEPKPFFCPAPTPSLM